MFWLIVLFLITCISLVFLFEYFKIKEKKSSTNGIKPLPFAKGLPIVGILLKIRYPSYHYFMDMKKSYGSIFMVKFGMREVIVLNDFRIIKKTLKENSDNFSGRWRNKIKSILFNDTGILFIDGDKWLRHRTFVLKVLKDFGFGTRKSLEIVQSECKYMIEELKSIQGKSINFSKLIPVYVVNIISQFIVGKRFVRNDPILEIFETIITKMMKKENRFQLFHLMFPIFEESLFLTKLSLLLTSHGKDFDKIFKIFSEFIKEHLKVLDIYSEGEDLMDRFLIEQHWLKVKNEISETFTNQQLIMISFELLCTGYETTSTTLSWSLFFMARHQDIQQQVHEEIMSIVGGDRPTRMIDKSRLIYTQAVMDEILRMSSIVPLSLIHRTFKDSEVDGFFIPQNRLVFTNLYACHRDRITWEKPFEFYPEHFLKKSENTQLKYVPREELIPFGIGKRQCLGESLARMEYFIFFVTIFQNFHVRFSENISDEKYEDAVRANEGVIRFSKIENFIFENYNQN